MRRFLIVLMACCCWSTLSSTVFAQMGAMECSDKSLEELRKKYSGSIHLTYIPLNDLKNLLNDKKRFDALCGHPPGKELLEKFRSFIEKLFPPTLDPGTAPSFALVELRDLKLGAKFANDLDGAVKFYPWLETEVQAIACFVGRYLDGQIEFQNAYKSLNTAGIGLKTKFELVKAIEKNNYVSGVRYSELIQAFKGTYTNAKQVELKELERVDRDTYIQLQGYLEDSKRRDHEATNQDWRDIIQKLNEVREKDKERDQIELNDFSKRFGSLKGGERWDLPKPAGIDLKPLFRPTIRE
jgi:hypothetical protein